MGITHVIRGEDLIDSTHRVLALRAALGGGRRRRCTRTCRSSSAPTGRSCRSATARSRSRTSATAGYLPEALVQLPRAPRLGAATTAARCWTLDELVAEFDLERVTHAAGGVRPREARLDERRVDPAARRSTTSTRGSSPLARGAVRRRARSATCSREAVAIAQERAVDARCSSSSRWTSCSSPTTTFAIDAGVVGASVAATDRVGEVLDAVIAHVETCEWTVEALDLRAGDRRARHQAAQGDARALRRGRGARTAGLPLFDSIVPARPRAHARPAARSAARPPG